MQNPPSNAINKDIENLGLLAIFHYIVGGIGFLFACFPFIHLVIGVALIRLPGIATHQNGPAHAIVGYFFTVMAAFYIVIGWTTAIATIISGRMIAHRRSRMFSFVMGAILCLFMPFGTILGIFTIILLNKDSVKDLYAQTG